MSDYKTLKGLKVNFLASDPPAAASEGQVWYNGADFKTTVKVEAFTAGNNVGNTRQRGGSAGGAQTSAVVFGGAAAPPNGAIRDETEEYNGTSWAESGDLNQARLNTSGFGTQTAAVCCGGRNTHPANFNVLSEEYNGTSWTVGNAMVTDSPVSAIKSTSGTQTAGFASGGFVPPPAAPAEHVKSTEEYDGTSWTSATDLPQFQAYNGQAGTQTAIINSFGNKGSSASNVATNDISLEYDGTNYAAGGNGNITPAKITGYNGGSGTQTASIFIGGEAVVSVKYDGTSFSTGPSMAAARGEGNASSGSPSQSTVVFCGSPVPAVGNTTEEFSAAETVKTITDS